MLCRSTVKADVLLSVHTEVFNVFVMQRPNSDQGLHVIEVSKTHTHTHNWHTHTHTKLTHARTQLAHTHNWHTHKTDTHARTQHTIDTRTHTYTRTRTHAGNPPAEWSTVAEGATYTTHNKHETNFSCSRRDSNPQSQQSGGYRPTP